MKTLSLAVIGVSFLAGNALAQDARTVIADAQRALGNPTSVTYSGSARDVAFQQCGANATALICYGTHDPMRPITSYVRVIDLNAPTSRHTGTTMNFGAGGSTTITPGTFFQQVTAQQADVSQAWGQSLELYITPWGFLKGAAANNATAARRSVEGENFTVLSWSPTVKAPSGKSYTVNGYVNSDNLVERVETWLGENLMGDMHIVANYSDWRDFGGGVLVPTHIEQTRGGWPFFEVEVTNARGNPPNLAALAPQPAPPAGGPRWWSSRRSTAGADAHEGAARPGSLALHDGRRQLRLGHRRVRRLHHDARGRPEPGACPALHRRDQASVPRQADPLRVEQPSAWRPHARYPGRGGRGCDGDRAGECRRVLHSGAEHAAHVAR